MKIAICFFGQSYGTNCGYYNQSISYKKAFESVKKYIIQDYDVDIFFHTWITMNDKEKNEILNDLKPKYYEFQEQINFKTGKWGNVGAYWVTKSRFYSQKKSLQLKNIYENKNNIKYDWVFLTRFDCIYSITHKFNTWDNKYFYIQRAFEDPKLKAIWNPDSNIINNNSLVRDYYFFSDSNNMEKFKYLYDWVDTIMEEKNGIIVPIWHENYRTNIQYVSMHYIIPQYILYKNITPCKFLISRDNCGK